MFGSEVMQSDARGFDNEGICNSSHKVKKTGNIGIKNNGLDVSVFLVRDGLIMLHDPVICERTAVVLYEQDLMGDQLKRHHKYERAWPTMPPWLFDARWMDCSNFIYNSTWLKRSLRSSNTHIGF